MIFLFLLLTVLMLVCAGLIYLAMRRYPAKLDAVLQGLGFKLEIHGESDQASTTLDSEQRK